MLVIGPLGGIWARWPRLTWIIRCNVSPACMSAHSLNLTRKSCAILCCQWPTGVPAEAGGHSASNLSLTLSTIWHECQISRLKSQVPRAQMSNASSMHTSSCYWMENICWNHIIIFRWENVERFNFLHIICIREKEYISYNK